MPRALSPSPGNASQSGLNLDSFMKTRVETRVSPDEAEDSGASTSSQVDQTAVPPVTPKRTTQGMPSFRDENIALTAEQERTPVKTETPTPTRAQALPAYSVPSPRTHYVAYHQYLAYSHLLPPLGFPTAQAGPSTLPVTPQHQRTYTLKKEAENSPLPPSSPPAASSPISTPHRPPVNLVSSPGPMGPLPNEEEYDTLPYTLPPGPYSPNKPDLSYAALVGQAILSSPEHRLTLQEIYDWITIVYPHFKRGETTWMNSIRHVLSTSVVFRKVLRERSIGRTQWAIWDEDLECFKGGGFRKHLCKDIINNAALGSKSKGKSRKRTDMDDATESGRKAKRVRKEPPPPLPAPQLVSASYMPATMSSHPLFPPTRPTTHHQPYYESCMQPQQSLPADVIFPPLPAGVGYSRVISTAGSSSSESSSSAVHTKAQPDEGKGTDGLDSVEATPPKSDADSAPKSSSSAVPELTPNHSSSSPPPTSSELGVSSHVDDVCLDDYITIGGNDDDSEGPAEEEEETVSSSFLSPVKYWGESPKVGKAKVDHSLKPGIKLDGALSSSDEDDQPLLLRSSKARKLNKKMSFPPMPASPTLNRKAHSRLFKVSKLVATSRKSLDAERPRTPPSHPSTPPRSTRQLPISSIRTPLSSKGINPAALHSEGDDDDDNGDLDSSRTPRKRVVSSGAPIPAPVTPRRLVFPSNQNDSPYRTPGPGTGGNSIFSPFRTPGSRSVFDPHDPAALLDDELNRMGAAAGAGDSPTGLFGKGRGSLLYDSPGLSTSPGQYARWW
ncbi:hypothetical protein DXG03_009387 [Asterophora parasitica]|uniref:Fork-head domain-containing protein n=1 Tax=Asterophora parasitica TaxID=117018 RepID=A0A9P7KCZ4_9AGAR|nr:hypothetical protein DXG03_009387 [Asterophora parasitica]